MVTVDYDQLYRFDRESSLRGRSMIVTPSDQVINDGWALLRREKRPRKAIHFEHHAGRRICDVIWACLTGAVLISQRFRNALDEHQITGWSTYPAAVYDGGGKRVPGYFGLSVTGRAGPRDRARSKTVLRGPFYDGGPKVSYLMGFYFKNDQWDGSDIFVPEGTAHIIVTQCVKDVLKRLTIPNVAFTPLNQHESQA